MQASESVQEQRRAVRFASDEAILEAVGDRFSREIMASTMQVAKPIEEISYELKIPLSTCYRRVAKLTESGVLVVERTVVTASGKKFATYRAAVKEVRIEVTPDRTEVRTEVNEDAAERLRIRWLSARYIPA